MFNLTPSRQVSTSDYEELRKPLLSEEPRTPLEKPSEGPDNTQPQELLATPFFETNYLKLQEGDLKSLIDSPGDDTSTRVENDESSHEPISISTHEFDSYSHESDSYSHESDYSCDTSQSVDPATNFLTYYLDATSTEVEATSMKVEGTSMEVEATSLGIDKEPGIGLPDNFFKVALDCMKVEGHNIFSPESQLPLVEPLSEPLPLVEPVSNPDEVVDDYDKDDEVEEVDEMLSAPLANKMVLSDKNLVKEVISKINLINTKASNRYLYVQEICKLLEEAKRKVKTSENKDNILQELQIKIEKSTILFDEKSIYKTSLDLFDRLTCENDSRGSKTRVFNMRNMLVDKLKDPYINDVLNALDVYTVEVLVIYVLGQIFNDMGRNNPVLKAATVIDKLGSIVLKERVYKANLVYMLHDDESTDESVDEEPINIDKKCKDLGGAILNYLMDRDLLEFIENPIEQRAISSQKFRKKSLYVRCKYDLNLIPVKLNLPMVVKPVPWHIETKETKKGKTLVTALSGGYLTDSVDVYYRYRLLSSKNPELFKLRMTYRSEVDYLPVISALQSVGFRIDDTVLEFLNKYKSKLIEYRLLSDDNYIGINPDEFVSEYMNSVGDNIRNLNYKTILSEFMVESQKARNEDTVLGMAKAYSGLDVYFPAFQDFRGRVYRTGIFNLHEGDLYRSLLVFKIEEVITKKLSLSEIPASVKVATAKRYDSSFNCDTASIQWFDKWYSEAHGNDLDEYIMDSMKKAKEPFQFMRKALLTLKGGCFEAEPVFMDASSSAYQIMAYLLQDSNIAYSTNLIMNETRSDLYMILREEYLNHLREGGHITPKLETYFSRSLVKRMFMPLTYGKTVKAIADDIYSVMNQYISYKTSMKLASESYKFWCNRYSGVDNLLKLFGCMGSLCSSLGRGVKLSTPLFYSYQDYRKFEKQSVWIYSNKKGKGKPTRHKISFNVLTTERNVLKSKCATFANFIHQKDALVAINTVRKFYETYGESPIYTVHDCFVSNYEISEKMADIYKETLFKSLGNPMELINVFIFNNLIAPRYPYYMKLEYDTRMDYYVRDNNIESFIELTPDTIFKDMKSSGYHCNKDPIPVEHLNFFIQKWVEVITKYLGIKKAKKFEERGKELVKFYNNYVVSLCDLVIEIVYGNKEFVSELNMQRLALNRVLHGFETKCFNSNGEHNVKKNYSLT